MINLSCDKRKRLNRRVFWSIVPALAVAIVFLVATNTEAPAADEVTVTVTGLSWDADSGGFAFLQGLSRKKGTIKAGRRGSRISVDGQPERYAISGPDAKFKFTFKTDQPTFRLIAEGDRFPQTITQPYKVPRGSGEIDVGRVGAPRGEGPEHTWPLLIVAGKLGYGSSYELLADNNAVVRILTLGSGEEGGPGFTNNSSIEAAASGLKVYPFDMDKKITFLQMTGERIGAYILVVPFSPGEPSDKTITLHITDSVTEPKWNPPRPWKFDPLLVSVRKGFATAVRVRPSPDQ